MVVALSSVRNRSKSVPNIRYVARFHVSQAEAIAKLFALKNSWFIAGDYKNKGPAGYENLLPFYNF